MPKSKVLAYRIKDDEIRGRMFHSYRGPRIYEDGIDYIILCIIPSDRIHTNGEIDRYKLADAIPLEIDLQHKNKLISSGIFETNEVIYVLRDES